MFSSLAKIISTIAVCTFVYTSVGEDFVLDKSDPTLKGIEFADTDEEKILYIYIGIDYIPAEIVELFSKLSGIKVITDIFDSDEILEAKLLAGGGGYDLVFPTAFPYFSRQLNSNIYQKIDKSKFNFDDFDQDLLDKLATFDSDNEYCLPFQWGISGLGVNTKIVKEVCPDAPMDSLALVFDTKYISKLAKYGVSIYDSQYELFPAVLAYLGEDPERSSKENVEKVSRALSGIRKYIFKFTNYGFEDLSSGSACVVFGTSGDIKHVQMEQEKIKGKSDIKFVLPKEGASLWIDVAAIPVYAKHPKNAMLFLQFIMSAKVNARIANSTTRATCTLSSKKYVDKTIINDITIYPDQNIKRNSYVERYTPGYVNVLKTKMLTKIKSAMK